MKRFIFNISSFFIILLISLYCLQFVVDEGLKKQENNTYKDWNLIFSNKINSDIIILGSSRAWVHYNPKIIEDITNLSCYNLGIDGGMLLMQYSKWESFINNNKLPKIVVLNVDVWSLGKRNDLFVKQQFLPYLAHSEIYYNLRKIDSNLVYDRYIPLFKYHGYLDLVYDGILSYFDVQIDTNYAKYKGFAYKNSKWTDDFEIFKNSLEKGELIYNHAQIKLGFTIIKKILKKCKENNIFLILSYAPQYYELTQLSIQHDSIVRKFEEIAKLNKNVYFWNYSNDSLSYSTENFENSMHLNNIGAEKFSIKFANDLNKCIILNE